MTVTGTVTVNNPDTGNKLLAATIVTSAAGSNCPSGGTDSRCSISVPVLVPGLTITQAADTSTAVPGQKVTYTVTINNSGQTAYTRDQRRRHVHRCARRRDLRQRRLGHHRQRQLFRAAC